MKFYPGFDIRPSRDTFGFEYGDQVFGPEVEIRSLEAIRSSLSDPTCDGPEKVYAIAMDVGKSIHREKLQSLHQLFGVVTYASGSLGNEPIRSQGHIHKGSDYAHGWSTPEVYEIWSGSAIILMQEKAKVNPGRCFAVYAQVGEVVIVPPFWAHATISADSRVPLTFGAWCDRDFGFEYSDVRALGGLAFFPTLDQDQNITWKENTSYANQKLTIKSPRLYNDFDLEPQKPIYTQFEEDQDRFQFVVRPDLYHEKWIDFVP